MKKNFKRIVSVLTAAMLIAALTACGSSSSSSTDSSTAAADTSSTSSSATADTSSASTEIEPVTLTYATMLASGNINEVQPQMIADYVNEKLGGEYLTIDCYYSSTLAGDSEMLDAVLTGVADMGHLNVSASYSRLPILAMCQTNGISYASSEAATRAVKEFIDTQELDELAGLEVLLVQTSTNMCFATQFPVHSMADLAGHQVRGTASDSEALTAWGATPVTLEFSECYEALRNNLIEGLFTNSAAPGDNSFDDVVSYYTYFPLVASSNLVIINSDKMASLQPEMQEAIREAADYVFESYQTSTLSDISTSYDNQHRFLTTMEEVIFLSEEALAEFNDAVSYILDDYIADLDAQGLNGSEYYAALQEIIDEYNELYPQSTIVDTYEYLSPDNIVED
ncbi:MAG: TRAP transporter substrate-binding protein DctP [Oscillospiraceae bacterium]|nr:TRAP transporter substrate-binding protein DctP [Oscillospiraceae bacterium]